MRKRRVLMALVALACAASPAIGAATPSTPPLPSIAEQTVSRVFSEGRGLDQATNPDYLARTLPAVLAYLDGSDTETVALDPFRAGWAPARGQHRDVAYRNRYGVRIVGDLWAPNLPFVDPVTGVATNGPFPALVLVPGGGSRATYYEGIAQSIAEAGYVVLGFDPQAQGRSDTWPSPEWCAAGGAWQQPQEGGLREQGECAGVPPPVAPNHDLTPLAEALAGTPAAPVVDLAGLLLRFRTDPDAAAADLVDSYNTAGPNYAFGAFDAHTFLVSDDNPMRSLIDTTRVGVLGHSLGAWGAATAANADPKRRFAAAVAFDGYGIPVGDPVTPTLFLLAENLHLDYPVIPDADPERSHPSAAAGRRWRDSDVDAMQVALRAGTHGEWNYVPYQLANPVTGPFVNASSLGERISLYYLQAWFDLQLKGRVADDRADWAVQRSDALRRLTAEAFDASVDGSSIGQGRFDPTTLANRSYTIEGLRTDDNLSRIYRSAYDMAGLRCDNMLSGC